MNRPESWIRTGTEGVEELDALRPRLTVICDQCGEMHPAELSHTSQFGGHDVYAVVCTVDWLTDYYTDIAIIEDVEELEDLTLTTKRASVVHMNTPSAAEILSHEWADAHHVDPWDEPNGS